MSKIENAIIDSTTITVDDLGLLSARLMLDFGSGGLQEFGSDSAFVMPKTFGCGTMEYAAGHFIRRVMQIADVERWDQLKGRAVRTTTWDDQRIKGIGHIVRDDWFFPMDDYLQIADK